MKEDFLIKIDGLQSQDGEDNNISLLTKGNYVIKNGKQYITYAESETTGFSGCTTTVKVEGDNKVSMIRYGPSPSELIIELGKRNVCHYETGYGALSLGISAEHIKNNLTDIGGELDFTYLLDMNNSCVSTNNVKINVKPSVN